MSSFEDRFTPYGDLGMHGVRLPQFKIDKKHYERLKISEDSDNVAFLKQLRNNAFKQKGSIGCSIEVSILSEAGWSCRF